MTTRKARDWKRVFVSGTIAGAIAGTVLAAILVIIAAIQGDDGWVAVKNAALPFLGETVSRPGFDLVPLLVGVIAHFAVAVSWGVLFAALLHGASRGVTMMAGPFYGVLVFIAMFYAVLPVLGLVSFARGVNHWLALFEHAVYGLTLAIAYLPFQREVMRPSLRQPKHMHAVMH
jgi:hypothetical protein